MRALGSGRQSSLSAGTALKGAHEEWDIGRTTLKEELPIGHLLAPFGITLHRDEELLVDGANPSTSYPPAWVNAASAS